MEEPTTTSTSASFAAGAPVPVPIVLLIGAAAWIATSTALAAQQGEHERGQEHEHAAEGDHRHEGLHFTHPLIAESVSPDTKVRLDHLFFDFPDGETEHSGVLEGEFALARSVSLEAALPYSYGAGAFGNARAALKFANYAFEEAGVLLGYGVQLELPTNGAPEEDGEEHDHDHEHEEEGAASVSAGKAGRGSRPAARGFPPDPRFHGGTSVEATLGTEEWEVAPFLNVGYRSGPLELVGWGIVGIPFDHAEQSEVGTELSWNLSGLYHVSPRVQALLELDGAGGISGHAVGEDFVNLSPGVRLRPFPQRPLVLGTSVGFPLASGTEEDPFDLRWKTSLFWHF